MGEGRMYVGYAQYCTVLLGARCGLPANTLRDIAHLLRSCQLDWFRRMGTRS